MFEKLRGYIKYVKTQSTRRESDDLSFSCLKNSEMKRARIFSCTCRQPPTVHPVSEAFAAVSGGPLTQILEPIFRTRKVAAIRKSTSEPEVP